MIQEYMTKKHGIDDISIPLGMKNMSYESYNLENTEIYITTFSSEKNDENTAISLSKLNLQIIKDFKPTVLTNESSEYFNKRLFPLINDFERKLRKLLYLISSINNSVAGTDNIHNLESLDLGKIFELLFTDKEFNKDARKIVNSKSWEFTQTEIIQTLSDLKENTLWGNLLGNETINSLVQNFIAVKDIRNSVMHAHNTSHKHYKDAKKLYIEINKQLDNEIETIVGKQKIENEDIKKSYSFNNVLSTALEYQEVLNSLSSVVATLPIQQELVNNISPALLQFGDYSTKITASLPGLSEFTKQIDKLNQLSDFSKQLAGQLPDLTNQLESLNQLNNLSKQLAEQLPDLDEYRNLLEQLPPK